MVVHWETSLKPLYVKTVWIDGRRHAILSKDDPVAKAISPIVSSQPKTSKNSSPQYTPTSTPSESPTFMLNANPLSLRNWEKHRLSNTGFQDFYRVERNCFTALKVEDLVIDKNPLSERVLQWLDLAGREHINLALEDTRMYMARHSVPEVETTHYKYMPQHSNEFHKRKQLRNRKQNQSRKFYKTESEDEIDSSEDWQSNGYPSSYISDSLQNYAKQTIDNNHSEIGSNSFLPTRLALSANIISFQDDKNNDSTSDSVQIKKNQQRISTTAALRQKFNESQNENVLKPEKQPNFVKGNLESQYIDMIRKKMSDANYNMKTARRQLHIFIPSMPRVISESKASSVLTVDEP